MEKTRTRSVNRGATQGVRLPPTLMGEVRTLVALQLQDTRRACLSVLCRY